MGKSPWGLPYPPTMLKPSPSGPLSRVMVLYCGGLRGHEVIHSFHDPLQSKAVYVCERHGTYLRSSWKMQLGVRPVAACS